MANKYIRHGETYCGDGTTSAAATSNGGVGAWNNINVFQGSAPAYGALAAGDNVYIRSKDAGGNNISVSVSANTSYGSSSATSGSPITWNIDDGVVWSGVSGTLTFTATGHYTHSLTSYNVFNAAPSNNLIFTTNYAAYGPGYAVNLVDFANCVTRNIAVDTSVVSEWNCPSVVFNGASTHYAPKFKGVRNRTAAGYFIFGGWVCAITMFEPSIELLTAQASNPLFAGQVSVGGISVRVFGGEIYGSGAVDGTPLFDTSQFGNGNGLFGLKFPRGMVLSNTSLFGYDTGHVAAIGADGIHGAMYFDYRCKYDSRSDGYYPCREAMLETSNNATWSYKFFAHRASKSAPANVVMSKLYSIAPAAKTVRLELLWPETLSAPTKDVVSINVAYVDNATGQRKELTTYNAAGGTLDASTATWTATTYGAVAFNRYKLEVTTPTSIKQDTEIIVTLVVAVSGVSQTTDILFIDPDVTVA